MNVFSAVILIIFAVIGLAATARELSLRLFCDKDSCSVVFITVLKDSENAEFVLRSALSRLRYCGRKGFSGKIVLDAQLDDKTRKICESICREYHCGELVTKEEFLKSLG